MPNMNERDPQWRNRFPNAPPDRVRAPLKDGPRRSAWRSSWLLAGDAFVGGPIVMRSADLSERQQRAQAQNGMVLVMSDAATLWFSQNYSTRAYRVQRDTRSRRGILKAEYRCQCPDFAKQGVIDCKHIFAERLRRGEIVVEGPPPKKRGPEKKATRRPDRERLAHDGTTVRNAHGRARRKMPDRIPERTLSLKRCYDRRPLPENVFPIIGQRYRGGKRPAPISSRASALTAKITCGLSASEMFVHFERMVKEGALNLRRAPNEDTLSEWMNDPGLTPVLRESLRLTALPFVRREIGAIIDSSKISQLMTAHYKEIEYGNRDKHPQADRMKCHALVGFETLAVMAVEFSGSYGEGTLDAKFLKPLVESAIQRFSLEFLLGDKAYLSEYTPQWFAEHAIQAVMPVKKRWFQDDGKSYNEPLAHLVEWFDRNEIRDAHEVYRLRSKIECLFSVLKGAADVYCWSRGRKRDVKNASDPCTAWINETLCKFIYTNLRTTVRIEEENGVRIDYLVPPRCFPEPDEPLLKTRRPAAS
ncbi:MAG: transposase [Vulcanimicrobiaceae bacterium]